VSARGRRPVSHLDDLAREARAAGLATCLECSQRETALGQLERELANVTAQRNIARRVAIALEAELAPGEPRLIEPGRTYVIEVAPMTPEAVEVMRETVAAEAARTGARFLVVEGGLLELGDPGAPDSVRLATT
jgi:hypothetical protein